MKKKFSIKLTKPIVGKRFGVFQHIMKGAGSEKVDMRKYSAGDSASQINRKLSAKYQELYTNIFQQEKSLSLDMFLDINYNRRGGEIANEEQVRAYAEDIISYCQKQQITITFFSPEQKLFGTTKLVEKSIKRQGIIGISSTSGKSSEKIGLSSRLSIKNVDEIRKTLHEILAKVKKTKKIYTSSLNIFLNKAVENKQRRAIVIFSDFLAMDEESKKLLHYLRKQHILFLFQLPIDQSQGQNYSRIFLQKNISPGKNTGEIELLQVD